MEPRSDAGPVGGAEAGGAAVGAVPEGDFAPSGSMIEPSRPTRLTRVDHARLTAAERAAVGAERAGRRVAAIVAGEVRSRTAAVRQAARGRARAIRPPSEAAPLSCPGMEPVGRLSLAWERSPRAEGFLESAAFI